MTRRQQGCSHGPRKFGVVKRATPTPSIPAGEDDANEHDEGRPATSTPTPSGHGGSRGTRSLKGTVLVLTVLRAAS